MTTSYRVGEYLPEQTHTATALQLFRYSAVTWNPHRIHFEEAYAHQEGHDGLAVHSHLRAALALRCVTEALGVQWSVTATTYRLRKPAYAPANLGYGAQIRDINGDSMVLDLLEHHPSGCVGFEGEVTVTRTSEN